MRMKQEKCPRGTKRPLAMFSNVFDRMGGEATDNPAGTARSPGWPVAFSYSESYAVRRIIDQTKDHSPPLMLRSDLN